MNDSGYMQSGHFDLLSDDVLMMVMTTMISIRANSKGLVLFRDVMQGAGALCALLRTCRRMFAVYTTNATAVRREMTARSLTNVQPLDLGTPFPFTRQLQLQEQSQSQLAFFKACLSGMALHCAGDCCTRARKSVARDFRRRASAGASSAAASSQQSPKQCDVEVPSPGPSIVPIEKRTSLVSFTSDGDAGFVCSRRRVPRRSMTHSRSVETLSHLTIDSGGNVTADAVIDVDSDEMGTPQALRCSPDGAVVAFVRTPLTESADESIPHSVCYAWHSRATTPPACVAVPPSASEVGAINSQEVWWMEDGRMAILWSTAYVHPIGTIVGASADTACYLIAVYAIDVDGGNELESCVGPFLGKAQTASATKKGDEVAVVVRKPPVGSGPMSLAVRTTVLHQIFSEASVDVCHSVPSHHPHDRVTCPSSVAISPQGDCLVAVHVAQRATTVEVLVRTASNVFVTVQSVDVTHWTRIGSVDDPFVGVDATAMGHELRLPYSIDFSYCGRFVSILDKRQAHALHVPNHALIVVDTALRCPHQRVRALPLASVPEVTPRSVAWCKSGMIVQGFHGALLLKS